MIRVTKNRQEERLKKRNKLRNAFYIANHEILLLVKDYSILYKVFMIIEYLQLTYFTIDERLYRMWTLSFVDYLRTICKYFQFKANLQSIEGSAWLYITISIIAFILILIMAYLFLVTQKYQNRFENQSNFYSVALFVVAFILMLYNTLLTIPISQFILNGFFCSDDSNSEYKCGTPFFLRLAISFFGISLHLIVIFFLGNFMINLDPFTTSPLAGRLSTLQMQNNIKKVILSLTIFLPLSFKAITPFIIFILNISHLIILLSQPSTLDQTLNFLKTGSAGILATISASVLLQSSLDSGDIDNLGFLYCFIACLIVSGILYGYEQTKMQTWIRNFSKIGRKGLISRGSKILPTNLGFGENDVVKFVYSMIVMIESSDEKVPRAIVHSLVKEIYAGIGTKDPKINTIAKKILLMKSEKVEEYKREIYLLLLEILYFMGEIFPHSTYIDLLVAYLGHSKLDLIWVALYKLQTLERTKGNIRIVFSGVRFMTSIESEIKEREIRKMETTGLNVPYVLKFQNTFFLLCQSISQSVDYHHKFWDELKQPRPVIKKIQNIGSKITNVLDECRKLYEKIAEMNPNHFKTLNLFGNFIEFILNDDEEAKKLLSKAEYINKSSDLNKGFAKDTRVKYSENSDFCVAVVSGNDNDIGIIKGFNAELLKRFHFTFDEVKGKNIDLLTPQVVKEHHNQFMKCYFKTNKASVMGIERPVFPMDKRGFIIPQNLLIKVIPNLEKGLEVIGLLSNISLPYDRYSNDNFDKDHYILFDQLTGIVHGVSPGCYFEFGIRPDIVEGNTRSSNILNMINIFPDEKFDGKKINTTARKKKLPVLDTTKLPQLFYIDKSDFVRIGLPKSGQEAFSRYPIKYELTDPEDFGLGINFVLMTFRLADGKHIRRVNSMVRNYADEKANQLNNFMHQFEGDNEEIQALIEQQDKKKRMDKYKDDGNMMNRWKRQQETNTADRERKIKERKIELSQKRVPKTIKILKCSLVFVFIVTSLMNGLEKILKLTLSENIAKGQKSVKYLGEKESDIPNICYRARVLDMMANFHDGLILKDNKNDMTFESEKAHLSLLLSEINKSQTEFEKNYLHYIENGKVEQDPINNYKILTPKGEVNEIPLKFIFGIFQYISSAEYIKISDLSTLKNKEDNEKILDNTKTDIAKFYIFENYARNLLNIHEEIRTKLFNSLKETIESSVSSFFILLIIELLVVLVSILGLLPLIFKVHNGMTQVMSLFAYVSKDEISNLAARCELFRDHYLIDNDLMKEGALRFKDENADSREASMMDFMSQGSKVDDIFEMEEEKERESDLSHSYEGDDSLDKSYKKEEIEKELELLKNGEINFESAAKNKNEGDEDGQSPSKHHDTEHNLLEDKKSEKMKKKKAHKTKRELLEELEKNIKKAEDDASVATNEKFEILHNFKENFTKFYLLKALLTSLVLFGILIGNYFWTSTLGESMIKATTHLNTLSKMNTRLNYINSFTLETVNGGVLYKINGMNMIEEYDKMIYDLLSELNLNIKSSFHFTLSDYQDLFSRITNDDICENFFSKEPKYNFTNCQTDEFFTKGLQTLIVKVNEDTRSIAQDYSDTKRTEPPTQEALNKLSEIDLFTRRIGYTIRWLVSLLSEDLDATLKTFDYGDYILFAGLNFFLIFLYCFLWVPYVYDLKMRIWRAQGMVNMIPFRVINENRDLMKSMEKAHFI